MPRLPHLTERGLETQHHLRKVLMELILEKGWEAVTVKDIAERAGIDRTTFYLHFKDKRALFIQCQRETVDQLLEGLSPKATLREHLQKVLAHVANEAVLYRVLLNTSDSEIEHALHTHIVSLIMTILYQSGLMNRDDECELSLVATIIASTTRSSVKWWLEQNMPWSAKKLARRLQRMLLRGIFSGSS